jgi:hypothetical protein
MNAGARHDNGRAGKRNKAIEQRRQEKRDATARAGVIASESETAKQQRWKKPIRTLRG